MALKSDKESKSAPKKVKPLADSAENKGIAKSKNTVEDEDGADDEEMDAKPISKSVKASKSKKEDDEDEEEAAVEEVADEWEKSEEDENWDPDFDEFDIPKSKGVKKAPGAKKTAKDEDEDDFKIDDDFKDMFNNSSRGFDDDDDDF